MKFTLKDRFRCIVYTIAFATIVIYFGHAEHYTDAILVGLGAGLSAMWVHITVIRRELQQVLSERAARPNVI